MKVRVTVSRVFDIGPTSTICTEDEWREFADDHEWMGDMLRDDMIEEASDETSWLVQELPESEEGGRR